MNHDSITTHRLNSGSTPSWPIGVLVAISVAGTCVSSGCVKRRIAIETEPPGALVWLNDAQVGRTPVDVSFTHHGVYDLRIEKEGFEPLVTSANTAGPMWDEVPLDFVMELLPGDLDVSVRWTFTLVVRDDSETALLTRATTMRGRVRADAADGTSSPATRSQLGNGALEPAPELSGEATLEELEKSLSDKPTSTESGHAGVPSAPPPTPDTPPNALPQR